MLHAFILSAVGILPVMGGLARGFIHHRSGLRAVAAYRRCVETGWRSAR